MTCLAITRRLCAEASELRTAQFSRATTIRRTRGPDGGTLYSRTIHIPDCVLCDHARQADDRSGMELVQQHHGVPCQELNIRPDGGTRSSVDVRTIRSQKQLLQTP